MERDNELENKVLDVIRERSGRQGTSRKVIMQYARLTAEQLTPVLQKLLERGDVVEFASPGGGWRWYMAANQVRRKGQLTRLDRIAESNYRRGYADGYIVALQDAADALGVDPPAAVWDHWQQALLDWVKAPTDDRIDPPALEEPKA